MNSRLVRSGCLLLATLLLFPLVPASPTFGDNDAGSGTDAGDYYWTALDIEPGTHLGRVVTAVDNADWYRFTAEEGQGVRVTIWGSPSTPSMWLQSHNNSQTWSPNGIIGYTTEAGAWYVSITAGMGTKAVSHYTFTVEVIDLPPQDDGASGRDASRYSPVVIAREPANGTLNEYDRDDRFTFNATAGETIGIRVDWHDSPGGPYHYLSGPGGYYSRPYFVERDGTSNTWLIRETGEHRLDLSGSGGNYTITFVTGNETISEPPVAPANDNKADAIEVSSVPATLTQSTANATRDADDGYWCGGDASVWYTFTPESTGLITIDTFGSDYDTILRVQDPAGRIVGCSDDIYPSEQSRLMDLHVTANVTYHVLVGGYMGETGELQLNFGDLRPVPEVDLRVEIDAIERGPIRTDLGDMPNLVNERRIVSVTVTNDGPDTLVDGWVNLYRVAGHRCTSYGSYQGGNWFHGLAPGESLSFEFTWDTTTATGDQTLIATTGPMWPSTELDYSDNRDCEYTYSRVGGLGGIT